MKKKSLENIKDSFKRDVLECLGLNNESNKKEKYVRFREAKGKSMYAGYIYWFTIDLGYFAGETLIEEYKDVKCIHIKPYRITETDVDNAHKKGCLKFNEAMNLDTKKAYVDYDPKSGNFHKLPDGQYQIVLCQHNGKHPFGPGWKEELLSTKVEVKENVKTDWYFPAIDDKEKKQRTKEGWKFLTELLSDVKNKIFENSK